MKSQWKLGVFRIRSNFQVKVWDKIRVKKGIGGNPYSVHGGTSTSSPRLRCSWEGEEKEKFRVGKTSRPSFFSLFLRGRVEETVTNVYKETDDNWLWTIEKILSTGFRPVRPVVYTLKKSSHTSPTGDGIRVRPVPGLRRWRSDRGKQPPRWVSKNDSSIEKLPHTSFLCWCDIADRDGTVVRSQETSVYSFPSTLSDTDSLSSVHTETLRW